MKQKLALYVYKTSKYPTVYGDWIEGHSDYIRISEYVEVDFPELPPEQFIPIKVAEIDAKIEEIQANAIKEVNELKQQKSELLALSHDTESH